MKINYISTQTKYLKFISFILGVFGIIPFLYVINLLMRKFVVWSLNYSTFDPNDSYFTIDGISIVGFFLLLLSLKEYLKEDVEVWINIKINDVI